MFFIHFNVLFFRRDRIIQQQLLDDERAEMQEIMDDTCQKKIMLESTKIIKQTLKVVNKYQFLESMDNEEVLKETLQNLEIRGPKGSDE